MEEFLNKLYSYENFNLYLIIAIGVLVVLFFVILFAGKKDKKEREIEATKQLQTLNEEFAFKEEPVVEKVEVEEPKELENNTVVLPVVPEEESKPVFAEPVNETKTWEDDTITINPIDDYLMPKEDEQVELVTDEDVHSFADFNPTPVSEETISVSELPKEDNPEPLLDKVEEKPFTFAEERVDELEKPTPLEVPTFRFDDVLNETEELPKEEPVRDDWSHVFSSVFAPTHNEEVPTSSEPVSNSMYEDEKESDFELPALKEEKAEEVPEQNKDFEVPSFSNYNFDDISGETYDINK